MDDPIDTYGKEVSRIVEILRVGPLPAELNATPIGESDAVIAAKLWDSDLSQ
ncbi:hypothetical protein [Novipirellula artificiosorum]|uniref:Uncharacterized protein n=1 Tax=Novipirellula artificiosorum TaxID=2528016 RepID=A0A5C6E3P3_9BACT|nr:hypothetical protein [Novipirellula artificiosorum]TWU42056.1 hypothetical protein Poly41_03520 [Novipirellula artificiosorum]